MDTNRNAAENHDLTFANGLSPELAEPEDSHILIVESPPSKRGRKRAKPVTNVPVLGLYDLITNTIRPLESTEKLVDIQGEIQGPDSDVTPRLLLTQDTYQYLPKTVIRVTISPLEEDKHLLLKNDAPASNNSRSFRRVSDERDDG